MTVWIAQCLCPDRHCIVATAGEAEDEVLARSIILSALRYSVGDMLRQKTINPWCALCGAEHTTWRYEVGRTSFQKMEEALPKIREIEEAQAVTNALLGDLHRTRPQ